jgi:DNA-binding MarR family transcriptional regulator
MFIGLQFRGVVIHIVLRYILVVEERLSRADYQALSRFRFQIRRFLHFSEEAARSEGLEPQQHQLLLAIEASDDDAGPTVGHLAEQLFIRHHSAVGLLDRLEERGLVARARDAADRRLVRVRLTNAGSDKLHHLARQHRDELRKSGPELVEALRAVVEQRS